jgi:hypothetical protein
MCRAYQQLLTEAAFECAQILAYCRLRQTQTTGRGTYAAGFYHCDQITDMGFAHAYF